jgi:hypothetical protein
VIIGQGFGQSGLAALPGAENSGYREERDEFLYVLGVLFSLNEVHAGELTTLILKYQSHASRYHTEDFERRPYNSNLTFPPYFLIRETEDEPPPPIHVVLYKEDDKIVSEKILFFTLSQN